MIGHPLSTFISPSRMPIYAAGKTSWPYSERRQEGARPVKVLGNLSLVMKRH